MLKPWGFWLFILWYWSWENKTKFGCEDIQLYNLLWKGHVHSSKETQLFWTHFSLWPWVTDPEPGSCTFCQMVLRVTCEKPRCDIPNGSLTILTCLSTCLIELMTKQLKSHCNQCKLGMFFSKWCISLYGIESFGHFFNPAVFQVMF